MRKGLLDASARGLVLKHLPANVLQTQIPQDVCIFCASRLHFAATRARKPPHICKRALHFTPPLPNLSGLAAIGSNDDNNSPVIHQSPPNLESFGSGGWAKSTWEDELTPEEEEQKRALKSAAPTIEASRHERRPIFRIHRKEAKIARDSIVPPQRNGEGITLQASLSHKTAAGSTPDGAIFVRRDREDEQQAPAGQNVVQRLLARRTGFDSASNSEAFLSAVHGMETRALLQQSHARSLKPQLDSAPTGESQTEHRFQASSNKRTNLGENIKSLQPQQRYRYRNRRLDLQGTDLKSSAGQIEGAEERKPQGHDALSTSSREKILDHHIAQDREAMQGRLGSWKCVQCASTNSGWCNACAKCNTPRQSDSPQVQHWAHVRRKPSSVTLNPDTSHNAGYSEQSGSATQRASVSRKSRVSSGKKAPTRLSTDDAAPAIRRFQWPPSKKPQLEEEHLEQESKTRNRQYVELQGIRRAQSEQDSLIRKVLSEVPVGQAMGSSSGGAKLQHPELEAIIPPQTTQESTAADNEEREKSSAGWARWTPDESDLVPEFPNTTDDGHVGVDSFVSGESSVPLQPPEPGDMISQEDQTALGKGPNSARNNPKWSGWVRWTPDTGLDNSVEAKTDPDTPSADIESEPLSVKPRRVSKRASEFVADEEPEGARLAKNQNAGYGRTSSRRGRPQRNMAEHDDIEEDQAEARTERRRQRKKEKFLAKRAAPPTPILLPEYITVANLATALRVRSEEFTRKMISLGFDETSNDHVLDSETAGLIAQEFNFEPIIEQGDGEDLVARPAAEDKSSLPPRPPVVTIMGHVDHGKTTLLDYLRKSSVAASEHGGITQHIGAFSVSMPLGRIVTFLDTPGHAAFLSMRQRGANVTDIVVLVVAADDSVKPQTVEAIKHAQAAKVPIIVAINKIDKEDANVEAVKRDLARHSVDVEDYGGDTQVVCVSGKTGQGMNELEDAAIALADILDMRAETDGQAEGWVLEATTTKAGRIATVLVRRGTLRPGDIIVAGSTWARVRNLKNEAGVQVESAGPGTPVEVDGWREQPSAGEEVLQAPDEQKAKSVIEYRLEAASKAQMATDMAAVNETRRIEQEKRELEKRQELEKKETPSTDKPETAIPEPAKTTPSQPTLQEIPFIIKADVSGSVEAVLNSVTALGNSEVRPSILRSGVGPVTEFDVEHAAIAKGHIVSFNTPMDAQILRKAEKEGVQIIDQSIIYRLVDDVRKKLEEFLPPLVTTKVVGEAEIAQIFEINVRGRVMVPVAGCKVRNLVMRRNGKVRVLRGKEVVYDGMFHCQSVF